MSVTLKPFVDDEEFKVVSLNPLVVLIPYSDWVWSMWTPCVFFPFGFFTLKLGVLRFLFPLSLSYTVLG